MAKSKKTSKSGPVTTAKVNPLVMAQAKRLAGQETSRIQIVDETTAIVYNSTLSRVMHLRGGKRA